ncbi:hypothetical protein EMPG_10771 [Blastomyces silverae]|uniref:Uncharacterized protein n=1 Tax=Blastomyces silverae TaxID=2060906 RepID=A0A0H1B438_9EURO|nr:hypothetical protein EMPG_10771 [Blastomyces silverae]
MTVNSSTYNTDADDRVSSNIEHQKPTEYTTLLPKAADASLGVSSHDGERFSDLEYGGRGRWQLVTYESLLRLKGSIPVVLAYTL